MNFLDKIKETIFDWVLAALGCVLAALGCYLIRYKSNVDNLKTQVEELRGARDRLQHDVETAIGKQMKIEDDVKRRLTESDDIIAVAEKILEDNKGWYLNMMSRYQVSKRADKAASKAKNLKDEILKFNRVGYRESTQVGGTAISNRGYEAFESRRLILTKILEALKSPNITRIGLYGMGGIGKTMLVKEVLKQAEKDKLFNKYLFVDVSNAPDLKKIQREIAGKLALKLEGEITESVLADRLCERLKQENRVLIILDNIWKYLDLETLGIFFGDDQKGWKLLLTTRLQNTLHDMETQKQFPVGLLEENEAISLFEKIVGDLAKTGEFKSNMPQIVEECAGLPIAITTVANALKTRKHIDVWKHALNQLKMSRPVEIVGTDGKAVYKSIKLSYDFLPDEEKSLLLLCSLHAEDYNMKVEDLLKYAVGWDLLKNDHKIKHARSTVHKLVEGLKDSCLLLDGNYNGTVKMHDVIRDVVIYIAAEEKHMFTINDAVELQNLSKREDAVAISLPYINDNLELPNQSECSKLELLLLFYQENDFHIPDSFFEGLKNLKVLKLSRSWSGLLPSTLLSLENLQTLCLDGEVQNAIIIGRLKNLKALSLSLSNIEQLPKEIGQLTHLQLLDLKGCYILRFIPPNVLSNLKRLEELYLPDEVEWGVDSTEKINAMVSELDHLSHLTKLHICIKNAKILPKAMVFESLESYRIAIGSAWLWNETSETPRILKLKISFQSDYGYKVILRKCETLILGEMKGVKNILYELDSEGFQSLKHLIVQGNDEIQYIIKSMGALDLVFPSLESITLLNVNNLERICYTRLPTKSFCNLREVKVRGCCKLEFVFSSSMVGCFSHLQKMNIEDCKIMSAIVAIEGEEEIEVDSDDSIMFANLYSLKLRNLFKLKGFLSVVDSLVLFNGKVVFPNLEELEIEGMDSMKMIWPDQLISDCFRKLETMTVSGCTNLTNIVRPNMLRTLRNLKELKIYDCDSLEEVFEIQGTNNVEESRDIASVELISLTLRNLEKVKHVWSMNPQGIITFAKLRTIEIEGCSSLKSVFPTSVAKDLMQLEELEIKDCAMVEEIVAKEEGIETTTLSVFPQLTTLTLQNLPEIKSFYLGKHISEWLLLNYLQIFKCDKLKIFGSNKSSVQETNGLAHHANLIQQPLFFIEKDKFPNLERLELDDAMNETCSGPSVEFCRNLKFLILHGNGDKSTEVSDFRRLKNIVPFSSTSFCNLLTLEVWGSDVLISLLTPSTARTLMRLEKINIKDCERMREIVANVGSEAEAGDEIAFNKLTSLEFDNLPSLTAFHLGNRTIKFSSLNTVTVTRCPKLKIFSSGVLSTPNLSSIWIEGNEIIKEGRNEDLDLNATIKEYCAGPRYNRRYQKFAQKTWLIDSDGVMIRADEIFEDNGQANMKCCNGCCPNLKSRYQVSKRSHKKGLEVKEIKDKGKFNRVGYRESTQVGGTAISNRGYEALESRRLILTKILEALKSPNINRIGLYGMGGIGKTMLVKEVLKQAEKDKLFNKYLFVDVSNAPDLKKIQREIAGKLALKLEGEITESALADRLFERLKQENRVLIILDDIWKYLDLEALGIFFGDDQKGCKLLLTSRFQNILRNFMDTQKQFPVGVLSDNESISLFEKIVGDLAKTGEFKSNMPQIVKECAGLPIAITTVANALKNNRNIHVWKYALNQLKMSSPIEIEGMDEKVYKSIKMSYELLKSNEAKSLLLLCSLHGEDDNIEVEGLLRYGVSLGLFDNVDTIDGARCRVHSLVERLKDSSLLLDGNYNGSVKMHDVIRDVVINIAAEERHMFTIRTVNELQIRSKSKDTVAISLPYINGDLELPNQFECSTLELLLLFRQKFSFCIPNSFFEGLKDLKVLKLSVSWPGVLPSSLSSLENLQTLCLDGEVQNAIIIGELKILKALSLSLSNIERLPKEIGQLTLLQLLDLGKCLKLKFIPPNVLSNLEMLEELYLPNNVEWEIEAQSTERINVMVSELDHLSYLTKLHICIKKAKILPKAMVFKRLESYRIAIGSAWLGGETLETSRILKLKISYQSDYGYKVLFRKCETLILDLMKGIKNNLYELDSEGFQSLKHLTVQHNDEIRYIFKSVGVLDSVFPSLESITLWNVNNLERICCTQLPMKIFCNLRVVTVINCCKLEFVFSSSMIECFSHLQKMNIEDCKIMSAIVAIEREEIEVNRDDSIMFANLHSLKLRNLFKLKGFLSVVDSLVLFKGKVVFPNLEELEIEGMDSMKMIWPDQLISDCFCKLETMTVSGCTNLTNIVLLNMLRTLRNLKELKIYDCNSLEEVFEIQGTNNVEESHDIAAAELISLTLRNLEKVNHVWSMDPQGIITFAKLRTIEIEGCSSLKSVFPTSVAKALTQLEELEIKDCATVEEIVAKEDGIETTTWFVFPQLTTLTLQNLPEIKSFYPGKHISEWPLLNYLQIFKCDKLKIFGSNKSSVQETNGLAHHANLIQQPLFFIEKNKFHNLERLLLHEGNETCGGSSAEFCCNLEVLTLYGNGDKWSMFPDVEAPIARAGVSDIRRLKNIVPFSSTSFHYLMELVVDGSDVLTSLLTPSTARTLVQLQQIIIHNCERMTEIVANEGSEAEAGDEIAFNNLTSLEFYKLPSLTAFHLGNRSIKFPSLDRVTVNNCPKLKIFCSGVLSTPKLKEVWMERKQILKMEGDGDVYLNATIKEYWEAKLETGDQKFAEKTDAGEDTTSEVGDTT